MKAQMPGKERRAFDYGFDLGFLTALCLALDDGASTLRHAMEQMDYIEKGERYSEEIKQSIFASFIEGMEATYSNPRKESECYGIIKDQYIK